VVSPGTLVYATNKSDHHNITEILLKMKVALNTIMIILKFNKIIWSASIVNEFNSGS
jgi:hypothetical protein